MCVETAEVGVEVSTWESFFFSSFKIFLFFMFIFYSLSGFFVNSYRLSPNQNTRLDPFTWIPIQASQQAMLVGLSAIPSLKRFGNQGSEKLSSWLSDHTGGQWPRWDLKFSWLKFMAVFSLQSLLPRSLFFCSLGYWLTELITRGFVFFCFRNLMVKRMTSCLHQLGVFDCN